MCFKQEKRQRGVQREKLEEVEEMNIVSGP